jgi:phage gp45-like
MAFRTVHTLSRATLNEASDDPMMQTMHLDFFNNDSRKGVERVQNYGFSSVPAPRSKQEGNQQQSSSGGGGSGEVQPEQPKGEAAEAIVLYQGGQRNHPLVVGVDDRRHRPRGLKPGENAQYDDIGQMTLMRRNGLYMLSLDSKDENGKDVERTVSMRHVQKEKQPRPQKGNGQGGGGQTGQQQQKAEDFKHEGETVNTEVKCTKGRISFMLGDEEVAYFDKEARRFVVKVETKFGEDASNPIYGVKDGKGNTVKTSGDGAVLVNATEPGPPTSEDTQA